VAQVEIISEQECSGHWRFEVQVLDDQAILRRHTVTLAWADYNLWSQDGADEPARVVDAVMGFLLSRDRAGALPGKFDASMTRRRFADADTVIPTLIGR
jgi:hypothetical protein